MFALELNVIFRNMKNVKGNLWIFLGTITSQFGKALNILNFPTGPPPIRPL